MAVIGNGASAMQLVPAIVDRVESLTVFQRSAQWAAPFPKSSGRVPRRSAAYLTVKKVLVDGLGLLRNRARTETFLLCPLTRLLGTRYLMLAKPFGPVRPES